MKTQLLEEFSDVFSDGPVPPMKGAPMDIVLRDGAKPYRSTHVRSIPMAYRDQVKKQLDDMVRDGVIEPVHEPSDWCHPIVVVDKKTSSEKRLTVDLKKLNSQVQRPVHPRAITTGSND